MTNKAKTAWRIGVLGLLVALIPLGIYWNRAQQRFDPEAMLDVSVWLKTVSHVRVDAVGDSVWEAASGSGFLVSSQRCEVWTSHHVIANAAVIEVYPRHWSDSSGIPASIVNSNPRTDIAILRMQHCDGIRQARLGDSDTLRAGDEVYAVGNPLGLNPNSISRGIVSHTKRIVNGAMPYIQTDATINQGNSGGALFNRSGEVVGVSTAIVANSNGNNTGISYALPVNLLKKETRLLHNGPPSWGDAGINNIVTLLTPDEATVFRVPDGHAALILTETPTEGPGAGKLLARDVIYQMDDTPITSASQATQFISTHNPDDTITFHLIRAGEAKLVDITLCDGWKAGESPVAEYYTGLLGMTLEMWRNEDPTRPQLETPVITKVQSLGPAHMAYIASSQKTVARNGPMVFPLQLDIKTITGAVYDGTYYPLTGVEALEELANTAFESKLPLLLEIEIWARSSPMGLEEPFQRRNTLFHKVVPALTTAAKPDVVPISVEFTKQHDPTTANQVASFDAPGNL
jgi:S1-C subfamily serine protease